MKIEIYNGLISDSNNQVVFDTKEMSLKEAIKFIGEWLERYFVWHRQQEDDFNPENPSDEYMDEESAASEWIINGHHLEMSWQDAASIKANTDRIKFLDNTFGRGYEILIKD